MKNTTTVTYVSTSVLLGMLVMLMVPSNVSASPEGLALYGLATITQQDANGNVIFSQTVHNQLFDEGEDFILANTFTGIADIGTDATQIGSICLGAQSPSTTESDANTAWNSAHDGADNASASTLTNCRTDGTVTASAQKATVGPLVFTAKADNAAGTHFYAGDTVTNIAVCDADSGDADVRGCTTTLFAVVDTSNVTLAADETVTVTYEFDLASAGS